MYFENAGGCKYTLILAIGHLVTYSPDNLSWPVELWGNCEIRWTLSLHVAVVMMMVVVAMWCHQWWDDSQDHLGGFRVPGPHHSRHNPYYVGVLHQVQLEKHHMIMDNLDRIAGIGATLTTYPEQWQKYSHWILNIMLLLCPQFGIKGLKKGCPSIVEIRGMQKTRNFIAIALELRLVCIKPLLLWHKSGSLLARVMASCLTAPSHCLKQCKSPVRFIRG